MKKHIWYRLEYKRVVDRLFSAIYWLTGTVIATVLISLLFEPGSLPSSILASLGPTIMVLAMFCLIVTVILTLVDKHEWELTKKIKGGTK